MSLPNIHFGRVLTHLDALYASLAEELNRGGKNLGTVLTRLKRDRVYRYLSSFSAPVATCPARQALAQRLTEVESAVQRLCEALRHRRPNTVIELKDAVRPFI